jgi:1-acyl-sn-glycerol-3-phosphate acyltransferase
MWGLLAAIVVVCVGFALHINWVEDISDFLPQNKENQQINDFYQLLGSENNIVIRVHLKDTLSADNEILKSAVETMANDLLKNDSNKYIKRLFYKTEYEQIATLTHFLLSNIPYFLTEKDYQRMDTLLTAQNIENQLINNQELLFSPAPEYIKEIVLTDPLHFSNSIFSQLSVLQLNEQYSMQDGYLYNPVSGEYILILTAFESVAETNHNKLLINNIQTSIDRTEKQFQNQVKITAFGQCMVSITNAEQIKKDSLWAVAISMLLILSLLIWFFRNIKTLLLIVASIGFGFLVAIGCISAFSDTVSVIAVGIVSIIFGIAVNYPLHFLSHYQHVTDKRQLLSEIVNPLLIGNITTVGAFLSLLFISSNAMKTLGLFSALLLVGSILFVLLFLPHLIGKKHKTSPHDHHLAFEKLSHFSPEQNKSLVVAILLITIVLAFFSTKTSFETDMHKINFITKEQQSEFEQLISKKDTTATTLYCISEGKNLEDALSVYKEVFSQVNQLKDNQLVKKQSGIGIFLPTPALQKEKIEQWNNFWRDRKKPFLEQFNAIMQKCGYQPHAFDSLKCLLSKQYEIQPLSFFSPLRENLSDNYILQTKDKTLIFTQLEISKKHLPAVKEKLSDISNSVYLFDNQSIIERMVNALSDDFNYVLFICGGIVFLFLLFSFGRLELALLAFVPMLVGWIWILGIMNIVGLKFNIISIILATFIFGQGDDYTIFVTEGLMYEHRLGRKMLPQFKNSVILSALIMFIGIGILIFAQHPAMRSLAQVTIIGMLVVVLMAYIFPPLIFKFLTQKNGKNRQRPLTLWSLTKTAFAFIIFVTGSLILSIIGLIFMLLGGAKYSKNRLLFRKIICHLFRFFVKMMPQVKYKLQNTVNEDFNKPAIIVANHQSDLDLLYLLALNPKITCLTNEWAQKFVFYRGIVRLAGYFSIHKNLENTMYQFKKSIADGCSVLIFPEGTRSQNGDILRFHKGAFEVANTLNLDILPIIVQGTGTVFPKNDHILRSGEVILHILPRITPQNTQFRQNITCFHTTKLIRHYFAAEFQKLYLSSCNMHNIKQLVKENYLYKGKETYSSCLKNLRQTALIEKHIASLPTDGTYYLPHCGEGEFAFLLALLRPDLQFIASETNPELLAIAQNCAFIPKNLKFCAKDEEQLRMEN